MDSRFKRSLFAAGLLCTALWFVSPGQVAATLLRAERRPVAELIVLGFVLVFISAMKLQLFVQAISKKVCIFRIAGLFLVANFVNLVTPPVVGMSVRSWYLGKETGQHESFAATILERYTNIMATLLLALLSTLLAPSYWPFLTGLVSFFCLVMISITALALSETGARAAASAMGRLSRCSRVSVLPERHLDKLQDAFRFAARRPLLLMKATLLSFAYQACIALSVVLAARTVGWESAPFFDLFIVLPLIGTVSAIPLTPSGLGLQEGAYTYFMVGMGATSPQALSLAVLLRARSCVLALAGAFVWYLFLSQRPGGGCYSSVFIGE